jgi:hypothetical protein
MTSNIRINDTIYIMTEVLIVVKFHTAALWVLTQCSVVGVFGSLRKACFFLPHSRLSLILITEFLYIRPHFGTASNRKILHGKLIEYINLYRSYTFIERDIHFNSPPRGWSPLASCPTPGPFQPKTKKNSGWCRDVMPDRPVCLSTRHHKTFL